MGRKYVQTAARRFTLWIVFFFSLLRLLSSLTGLYLDYHRDLDRIRVSLESVTSLQLPQVSRSYEIGDAAAITAVLEKLLSQDNLVYASVVVGDNVAWQRGKKPESRGLSVSFPLVTGTSGDVPKRGSLEVITDTSSLLQHFRSRFVRLLIGDAMEIFLFAVAVLLMVHILVTRHLESLVAQIERFDVASPCFSLQLQRKTSDNHTVLDQLVAGINAMSRKIHEAYATFNRKGQRLLSSLEGVKEAVITVDRGGSCTFVNDAGLRLLGLDRDEQILNKKLPELIVHSHGQGNETVNLDCLVVQSMNEARTIQFDDGVFMDGEGEILPVALRTYPVFQEGEVRGAFIFVADNTENRRLRREWKLLNEAVKQVPVMILIANSENKIEFVNAGVERMTGYGRDDLLGRSIFSFQDMVAGGGATFSRINASLQNNELWEGEIEVRTKWGTSVQLYSIVSKIVDEKGNDVNFIIVSRETSYELVLQNDLVNAKKMEAVGRLSAKFAHEFGNPLFGVRSVLKDFCNRTEFSTEDSRLLYLAHHECERMRMMVREFQQLYQESTGSEDIETLADIVDKVLSEARQLMMSFQVTCTVNLTAEHSVFIRNKNKLFLVMRNVILNAIESMAQTGGQVAIADRIEGQQLIVAVCDEGQGIKVEHQELIFEPFFSTKPEVEGAGLGLSVAYRTMRSMGGTITFASKKGGGAMFQVHIPIR